MYCTEILPVNYLIFSSEVPSLFYYSHIPALIVSLWLAIFVLYKNHQDFSSRLLFVLNILFSLLVVLNVVLWTNSNASLLAFIWPIAQVIYTTIPVVALYLFYVFSTKKDVRLAYKIVWLVLIAGVSILAFSGANIIYFDLDNCEAVTTSIVQIYQNIFFAIVLIWLIVEFIKKFRASPKSRRQVVIFFTGILTFLLLMIFTWQIAEWYNLFSLEQYGLYGMVLFIAVLSYLIVRYKIFNVKLLAAQLLVFILWVLIGSVLFVAVSPLTKIVVSITEILAIIFGLILIRSVKKEIRQREEIAELAGELKLANTKLKALDKQKTEFLSFASHQLRSPVTAIKGYSSMITEGSFGPASEEIKKAAEVIFQSSQKLILVIEDFLNITRIELGTMKYDFAEVDLKQLVESAVAIMKPIAEERHLTLSAEIAEDQDFNSVLDSGKISQVISNLIDNAIKYTSEGWIKVRLLKQKNSFRIEVKDSGVGIDEETMSRLFQKFSRAYDASRMNTNGTGLGLYVARQLVEAHGGKLWAESPGKGQGTTFIVELPMIKRPSLEKASV